MRRWKLLENSRLEAVDVLRMENSRGAQNGEGLGEERKQSMMESKLQRVLRSPVMSGMAIDNYGSKLSIAV